METRKKACSSCETKYTIKWDIEEHDLEPLTCPFCGYEVDEEEYEDRHDSNEDDSWN